MAGGMLVLEGAAGGLELLLVGISMGLAAVQAVQVAHHARPPLLHYGPAQRAMPGKEHSQPVGVHTSSLWATLRWTLFAAHEGSRQVPQLSVG
jgi:hypothetical protein